MPRSFLLPIALLFALTLPSCDRSAPSSHPDKLAVPQATNSPPMLVDVNSPEFKQAMKERLELMQEEERIREDASWFGKTGLSDDLERELPRYIRREFGKALFEPGAIKASDLFYVGRFPDGLQSVHYWRINDGERNSHFAYIEVSPKGQTVTGWGDKSPPEHAK